VPDCGAAEISAALDAAAAAQPAWAARPPAQRAATLRAWAQLLRDNGADLAAIMTAEQGKPLSEASAEVTSCADYLAWFADEAYRSYGNTIPQPAPGHLGIELWQPLGVAVAITPWNFPASMLARKAGAALAAGCALVAKPSELTPLSALAFAAVGERAGLPAGLLSVVPSSDADGIGRAMIAHPATRKLSFTGSTRVGKHLQAACGARLLRTSMELGGNAPFIVLPGADVEAAATSAVAAKFRNAGQTCISPNRFYVHDSLYDTFREAMLKRVKALRLGPGDVAGVTMGPLIHEAAAAKVARHVADAVARGARVLCGGQVDPALGRAFFQPTLLADVPTDAALCCEETFGPVAALVRVHSAAEAVAAANGVTAGLAAYVFGGEAGELFRTAEAVQAGMVGVNSHLVSTVAAPFGGVRDSGQGKEGSSHGMREYMEARLSLCQLAEHVYLRLTRSFPVLRSSSTWPSSGEAPAACGCVNGRNARAMTCQPTFAPVHFLRGGKKRKALPRQRRHSRAPPLRRPVAGHRAHRDRYRLQRPRVAMSSAVAPFAAHLACARAGGAVPTISRAGAPPRLVARGARPALRVRGPAAAQLRSRHDVAPPYSAGHVQRGRTAAALAVGAAPLESDSDPAAVITSGDTSLVADVVAGVSVAFITVPQARWIKEI
jgi:succinate-semialdehyde dehydrogenase/glutarate-semialdehyde dehydrogenase